ncbi:MAG: monovalent cation/H(+) antiporter subunit G [Gemmatimonadales bacterium]|nr:MAG: monovalent cation/H(+) antiporter subunit G [Gemmatimonadales bacterium]
MSALDWVSAFFLAGGAFFLVVSTVGLLRLPDFFSRSHAVGKSETLGSLLLLAGLAIQNGFALESAKLVLILIFIAATNPSGVHVLSRAALRKGVPVWIHPDDVPEAERRAASAAEAARAERAAGTHGTDGADVTNREVAP